MRFSFLLIIVLTLQNVLGQHTPHSRTMPGTPNSPFPYVASSEVGIPDEKLQLLRQELNAYVENGDVVGNEVLMIKEGKIFFHETFGWSDIASNKPVAKNSIWNIRSMTKPFTATVIMMLVEDNKLSLDDRVSKYVPEFKGNPDTTIGHLISHTSGYSRQDFFDDDDYENVETLKDWALAGATTEPTGSFGEFEYTDLGFVMSGYIIESLTGKSLKTNIEERIIQPLGLKNTRVNFSDDPDWRSKISTWYIVDEETGEYEVRWSTDREGYPIFGGAWGMFSTVLDFAEFLSCFIHEGYWNKYQLLEQETIKEMISPKGYSNGIPMYGYGWMLQSSNKNPKSILNYGHRGGDALAGYVFPEEDMIVVYMSHSRGGIHRESFMEKLNELDLVKFTRYIGNPIRPDKYQGNVAELSQADKSNILGHYKDNNGDSCAIVLNKNYLTLSLYSPGQQTKQILDLVCIGENRFAIADYFDGELDWLNPEAIIEFNDKEGQIIFDFKYQDQLILKAVKSDQ